jgi:hypothetical protein
MHSIEKLEGRIVPAGLAISPDGSFATFTDPDGDTVRVETSEGTFRAQNFDLVASGSGFRFRGLNLIIDLNEFEGADIKVVLDDADNAGTGNNRTDLGQLVARVAGVGINLGSVRVEGDLAQITAGDGGGDAVEALFVKSFARKTDQTLGNVDSPLSTFAGSLPTFVVEKGMGSAGINVERALENATVGRSLDETFLFAKKIGKLLIDGSVRDSGISARGADDPGSVEAARAIGTLRIGGSLEDSAITAGFQLFSPGSGTSDVIVDRIRIGGGFERSVIAVGVDIGADGDAGTNDDEILSSSNEDIVGTIGKLVIGGDAVGTSISGDGFGVVAELISSAKYRGETLDLDAGTDNILLDGTSDVRIREI